MTTVHNAVATGTREYSAPPADRAIAVREAIGKTYQVRLAVNDRVREDAYRLRYRSYLSQGHIKPLSSGLFHDAYDELPNARTVVIYDDTHPLASVRVCLLSRDGMFGSPAADTFGPEVRTLLAREGGDAFAGRAVESNRLVRAPEAANNQGLVFLLYRMAGYLALCHHAQMSLACVRTNHKPFYRRLGYEQVSEPRPYPGLDCEMQLMVCSRTRYDEIRKAVPMMDPFGSTTGDLKGLFAGDPVSLRVVR